MLSLSISLDNFRDSDEKPLVKRIKGYFVAGAVVLIPFVVTIGVLATAFNFLSGVVAPIVTFIQKDLGVAPKQGQVVVAVVTLAAFTLLVGVIGFLAKSAPTGGEFADVLHTAIEAIPGIGSVYSSFRQMSKTIAQGDESFRDVKLVEFPTKGTYTLAFVTSQNPGVVRNTTGNDDMIALFLPMGPNPVMGGHVIYASPSDDNVYDVDLTVEEGLSATITSGVTLRESFDDSSADEVVDVTDIVDSEPGDKAPDAAEPTEE